MLAIPGFRDIEMASLLLEIPTFLAGNNVGCRSKRRVKSFPVGNWLSLVRFH
jgi:hypothetical protein